jgi:hypothetical protein
MNATDFDARPNPDELQGALRRAVEAIRTVPPPAAQFDAWQRRYGRTVASLDPPGPALPARRKKLRRRLVTLAATAAVLAGVWFGTWFGPLSFTSHGPSMDAFAATVEQIQKAKTMTWKSTYYEHITSQDGKRTWSHAGVIENAYKAPGLYRMVRLDDKGKITEVEISDWMHGRKLTYHPQEKKATIEKLDPVAHDAGPFAYDREKLNAPNLQWVEKRKTATGEVNVFRHAFRWYVAGERDWSTDYWIDAKTKQLVAMYWPGRDHYDPDSDTATTNAPGGPLSRRIMGSGTQDIRYDVPLDDSLFRLEPPAGYTVEIKQRAHVTEKEMIDYFGILAAFNDKTFPDEANNSWALLRKIDRATSKPPKRQTAAERKLLDADMRYNWGGATNAPILDFFFWNPDSIVEKSFRYLGKGVKLGEKDRIVCWYKLKGAQDPNTYRVVYGDLNVKDVAPKDLPLPVDP